MSYFLSHDPAPPGIYPLSLHDALPILGSRTAGDPAPARAGPPGDLVTARGVEPRAQPLPAAPAAGDQRGARRGRSEEHTSELQSRLHLVCRLLLEKKKNKKYNTN